MADHKVVAKVAGREITEDEFNTYLMRIPQQQRQYAMSPEGREQVLTQYTNIFLFEKLGRDRAYDESEDYKNALAELEREFMSQYAFAKVLGEAKVTEEEARAYYEENPQKYMTDGTAHASHILTETEEQSLAAKAEIEAGEKTFAEAAQAYSTCPSKAQGGDLGTFTKGQMVPEFEKAVFEAEELGKVIGPVKTQFGYHLIRVDELNDSGKMSFEDAANRIIQELGGKKQDEIYKKTRQELIDKYGLEIMAD